MPRKLQGQIRATSGMKLKYWCSDCFEVTYEPWTSIPEQELPCPCAERSDGDDEERV